MPSGTPIAEAINTDPPATVREIRPPYPTEDNALYSTLFGFTTDPSYGVETDNAFLAVTGVGGIGPESVLGPAPEPSSLTTIGHRSAQQHCFVETETHRP